jgi:enterochelin esterase family protein
MKKSGVKKGRVVHETLDSKILKSNPLGDPSNRELLVYLPPSYDNDSTDYPVCFCLSGYTGTGLSFFNFQAWVPRMDERMDQLIEQGCPEMILVFPDCFTRYGGSQYLDSSATGAYRSYLVREMVPFVDQNYRSRADRKSRAVMGKSSGGYGAISIAMDHPELFSAVASHSGDMYFEYAYLPEFPSAQRRLENLGGLENYLQKFDEMPKTGREDHALLNAIAMSACYSPNPKSKPHGFDLPFDSFTGELNPQVWKKWKAKDPVEIVRESGVGLKDFRLVYLDCGRRDEFFLHLGARIFSRELARQAIHHIYEEFDEGHFNTQHRYSVSLRRIAEAISTS